MWMFVNNAPVTAQLTITGRAEHFPGLDARDRHDPGDADRIDELLSQRRAWHRHRHRDDDQAGNEYMARYRERSVLDE